MAPWDRLTLQKKIGFLVLSGLAVGLGVFSWLGVQSVNDSIARALDERLTIARMMASHVDGILSYIATQVQDAANFAGELPDEATFNQAADSLRGVLFKSGIATHDAILVDAGGAVLQATPDRNLLGTDMGVYPEVRGALVTRRPTVSGLVSNPVIGVPVVLVAAPIASRTTETIGALVVSIVIEESTNDAFQPTVTVGRTGYTEIVDGNGIVLARTSPGSPPQLFELSDHPGRFADLIAQGKATVRTCHRCHETEEQVQRRRDILAFAPLSTTSWGIAIRQSEEEALAVAQQLRQRLLLIGAMFLVSAFLLSWMMMQGIVNPIRILTAAAKKVATGDFKASVPTDREDEIGELSKAFATMTVELAKSRDELVLRNRELAALNSITTTVSQSLNLQDVLENALQKVLEITGARIGWVFLRDPETRKLQTMASRGPSSVFHCLEHGSSEASCACHQVLREGQTIMVNDVSQCALLAESAFTGAGIGYFVCLPLKTKDKTLGAMNLACSDDHVFTESDFRLLASIGSHVGLAVENSMLYEDAKEKEQLRGQLLQSAISAQEDERKRISRELHDELGQTLIGLVMSIESMENVTFVKQSQLKEKLGRAKMLVVRTLEDLRRLTLDLRPSVLDDLGLIAAVRAYTQSHLSEAGTKVEFETHGLNKRLASTLETALFRIIQEACNNIVKHAGASHARIELELEIDEIVAIIEDNGKGFETEAVFESRVGRQSLGLLGIKERVTLLGGTFKIESRVGQGTRLLVKIPLGGSLENAAPAVTTEGRKG